MVWLAVVFLWTVTVDDFSIETVSARGAVAVNDILPANDLVAVGNLELEGLIPARARRHVGSRPRHGRRFPNLIYLD